MQKLLRSSSCSLAASFLLASPLLLGSCSSEAPEGEAPTAQKVEAPGTQGEEAPMAKGEEASAAKGQAASAMQEAESSMADEHEVPTMEEDALSTFGLVDGIKGLDIPNPTLPMEGLLCAGQLSPEQMDGLKALGFASFVSLRAAEENGAGWEEAHAAATGTNFTRRPVAGAAGVNEAGARDLAELMANTKQPMVLYCGSSNRVGSLIALKAHHVESMPAEEALALGKSAGVTKMEPHLRSALGLEPISDPK